MTACSHHEALRRAVEVVVNKTHNALSSPKPATILVGAGLSTSSASGIGTGLPDYRSKDTGLYTKGHRPITLQEFLSTTHQQRRYFARSFLGYKKMQNASININHINIANMIQGKTSHRFVGHCITQNVDGLNTAAFYENDVLPSLSNPTPKRFMKSDLRCEKYVTELHGSIHYVVCMKCQQREHRQHLQNRMMISNGQWLKNLNPLKLRDDDENTPARQQAKQKQKQETDVKKKNQQTDTTDGENLLPVVDTDNDMVKEQANAKARPDGDFFLTDDDVQGFELPSCLECGGIIRPHVVLFGDNIPPMVKNKAHQIADESPVLITAGTSLFVPSAFTFARKFLQAKKPVVIFNDGPTRLEEELLKKKLNFQFDPKLIVKVDGKLEQTLGQFAACLPK